MKRARLAGVVGLRLLRRVREAVLSFGFLLGVWAAYLMLIVLAFLGVRLR